jgi:hypothetical protein
MSVRRINLERSIVIRALDNRLRWTLLAGGLALLLLALGAGSARAATYGSSSFSGGLEGWQATQHECKVLGAVEVEVLCKNESGLDAGTGNPAGSLAAKAKVLVNVGGTLKADTTWESPAFTVGDGGQGAVNLDRAFDSGGLVELKPNLAYTATLVDKASGQRQGAITETLGATTPFGSKSGSVTLASGHRYAVLIESELSATLAGASLGSMTANFDNVSVTGPGETPGGGGNGGNGAAGGNGAGGLSDARLESLIKSSLTGSAAVTRGKVLVKARCPVKVRAACKVKLQGLLKKGKPATAPRTLKIAKGKSKLVALKVKPKLKGAVAKRRKLLFEETVRAAKAKATVYKTLKLIRR